MSVLNQKVAISFIIPIKNEAANLHRCLGSITWADEIFVVDSQSTDDSAEIATQYGAEVVQFHFNGTWPKKKNWALENLPFRNEWIFILDADEVLPEEAEQEIHLIVAENSEPHYGYWINRRFMFMGKWLKHAYFPNWNLRLFRHKFGRFEKLTDVATHSGDNEVHEHVIIEGTTGRMKCLMDHYAFPNVEIFIQKHNRYSNWEARVALDNALKGREKALQHSQVGWRRILKQIVRRMPFRPLMRFIYVYLFQLGILDGREGYYFARLHATYELMNAAKTYEMAKAIEDKSVNNETNNC